MTIPEIEHALDNMVFLVDTREQETPSLKARLKHFPKWERQKLDAGDYSAKVCVNGDWLQIPVAIERKMNFTELATCYCKGRDRFQREFERAKAAGAKIYLLVENASWEDAYMGNYRSKMSANSLIASIFAWLARYDCQILFCAPCTTGRLIQSILYWESREFLMREYADD